MNLLRSICDLAFPRSCAGCGGPAGDECLHLCWDCFARLELIQSPYCAQCGDPFDGVIHHEFRCSFCVDHEPRFDRARSAARYHGPLKDMLHQFKYSGATHLSLDLAVLLQACVRTHYARAAIDAITCVPLHPVKERARTYNQARLLAADLARLLGKPLAARCLQRIRDTETQTHLSAKERARNVRGAFVPRQPHWIQGRSFLLVDDVMTTGATVSEVSRVLKEAGAAGVYVVTVARG